MKKYSKITIVAFLLFFCIGCDQTSKKIARALLPRTHTINYFNGFFRLHYAENRGGFLGLGAVLPQQIRFWIFTVMVAVGLICMLIYIIKSSKLNLLNTIALSLIIGGGLSNLIDRIYNNGAVIDFMNIGFGNIRTGIFNFADIDIMIGTSLLFGFVLWSKNSIKHFNKSFHIDANSPAEKQAGSWRK